MTKKQKITLETLISNLKKSQEASLAKKLEVEKKLEGQVRSLVSTYREEPSKLEPVVARIAVTEMHIAGLESNLTLIAQTLTFLNILNENPNKTS